MAEIDVGEHRNAGGSGSIPNDGPQRLDLFRGVTDRAAKHQSTDLIEDTELFEVGEVGIDNRGRRNLFGGFQEQDLAGPDLFRGICLRQQQLWDRQQYQ